MPDIENGAPIKKRFHAVRIVLLIFLLLVIVSGVLAWKLGYFMVVVKDPKQQVVVRTYACTDAVITSYNNATNATSYSTYVSSLQAVFDTVKGLSGYDSDPTCLFIAYRYYTLQGQSENAQKTVALLENYINEGSSPSSKLVDIESITQMKKRTSTDTNTAPGSDGTG